jgi:hypothetical protein
MMSLELDDSEISVFTAIQNGRKYEITFDLDDTRDFMAVHHLTGKMVRAAYIVTINGVKFVIEAGKRQVVPEIIYESLRQSLIINPELMPAVKPIGMDAYGNTINYNMISY